jgi:hypothetical protein
MLKPHMRVGDGKPIQSVIERITNGLGIRCHAVGCLCNMKGSAGQKHLKRHGHEVFNMVGSSSKNKTFCGRLYGVTLVERASAPGSPATVFRRSRMEASSFASHVFTGLSAVRKRLLGYRLPWDETQESVRQITALLGTL